MKKVLLSMFLLALTVSSKAQFNYDVTVLNQTFQPLTGSTNISGSTLWDEENYKVPIGFSFVMDGQTITDISLLAGQSCLTDTAGIVSGFFVTDIDVHDRGNAGSGIASSPISYSVSGTAPNRIFKLEVFNAGMYDEYDLYSTNDDSLSYQIWLYETSNIVEIHYGGAQLSHPSDYFFITGSPIVGFVKNIDIDGTGNIDALYYLKGNASAPTIDSVNSIFSISGGLNTYPSNGTVYRFAPKPVSVNGLTKDELKIEVLNNVSANNIIVNNQSNVASTYRVLNINGSSIGISGDLQNGNNNIDISRLPQGMYIIQVQNEAGAKAYRITKQ